MSGLLTVLLCSTLASAIPTVTCEKSYSDKAWEQSFPLALDADASYRVHVGIKTVSCDCVNPTELGGAEAKVDYLDEKGTRLGSSGGWCVVDSVGKWADVAILARRPEKAVRAQVRFIVPADVVGKIMFGNVRVERYELPPPPAPARSPCRALDARGRLTAEGKRFFPLGLYVENYDPLTVSNLDIIADSPFNTLVPYSFPGKAEMDLCAERGLKVLYNANVYYGTRWAFGKVSSEEDETRWVRETVAQFKDHPALLGWYANDEFGFNMLERLDRRYALLRKLDPDHVVWGCFMKGAEARHLHANLDVMGVDPYPVAAAWDRPDGPIDYGLCARAPREALAAAGGKRPIWTVLQSFDWRMYCPSATTSRMPTEAEIRAMTWMSIAGGANGILYFAFTSLAYEGNGNTFAQNWRALKSVASEVKARESLLLSEPGPTFRDPGEPFAVRTWCAGGTNVALVVNCSATNVAACIRFDGAEPLEVSLAPLAHAFHALKTRVEAPLAFRERMLKVHAPCLDAAAAPVAANETAIDSGWRIVPLSDDPTVRHSALDLQAFFRESLKLNLSIGGRNGERTIAVGIAAETNALTSRISVEADRVRITGATAREALQGCCRLEDEFVRRGRAALARGTRAYTRLFSPRMVHSGYGLDECPDAYLDQIAHAGMDAVLVYVADPPETTRTGRIDMKDFVRRARIRGLDVYAYASFEKKAARMHPLDPGARAYYDETYGSIVRNAPGLKGLVCVGESCAFPSRDPETGGFWFQPEPGKRRMNGFWPTEEWADWLALVRDVTRKYRPDFDVVFWTYNWFRRPEKARLGLLEKIPADVSLLVTFERTGTPIRKWGLSYAVDDYSISVPGPSDEFAGEAEVARRRGIRLYAMANTAGRTWDFGSAVPYVPAPGKWKARCDALKAARARWGLAGLMDSHHYGFAPNPVARLVKELLTHVDAASPPRQNEDGLIRDGRDENIASTWDAALDCHIASAHDLNGPLRVGPAYPLTLPGKDNPPPVRPYYDYDLKGNRLGSGWQYCCRRYGIAGFASEMKPERMAVEVDLAEREMELLTEGTVELEAALATAPQAKRADIVRTRDRGLYLVHVMRTVRNTRKFFLLATRGEYDGLPAILADEEANVRETIPIVERNSDLGWEPSMGYTTDRAALEHKLKLLHATPIVDLDARGKGFAAVELKPFGRAFTMSALVKPELPVVHDVRSGLVAKWGGGYWAGAHLMIEPKKTGGYVPVFEVGRKKIGPVTVRNDDVVLPAGRWVRLTGVCSPTAVRLYADGREIASLAFDGYWSDAEFDLRFAVGNQGLRFAGHPSYPVLCDSASVWSRALSDAEIAGLPRTAFEPDTPEIRDFFRLRDEKGRPLTAAHLAAWRAHHHASPMCAQALDELETILRVRCGDTEGAAAKFQKTTAALEKILAAEREPIVPDPAALFRDRYLSALEDCAPVDTAMRALEADCRRVAAEAPTCLPMAEARLAKICRRAGRVADAERLERKILASDLRLYPQLAAKFGKPFVATAGAAEGARVSRRPPSVAYYVSPAGDDTADGSSRHPFRTPERARDAVRARIRAGLPEGGLAVRLAGGTYRLAKTLTLTAADSGTRECPVVWEACAGERPVLTGGFTLKGLRDVTDPAILARLPAAARGRVKRLDLKAAGYPHWNFRMPQYGRYANASSMNDLYENGVWMTTARFPNEGAFLNVKSVLDGKRGIVTADIPNLDRWAAEPDLMAMGYWEWFWAEHGVRVTNVCARTGALALDLFVNGKSPFEEMRVGQTFFLENALCALDRPGEWYHDCRTGLVYLWPRAADAVYTMPALDSPLLALNGVHDLRIEDLVFEYARRDGVTMTDCHDVAFVGNLVRNCGWNGVVEQSSRNVTFAENVFHTFGAGPLRVQGGARKALTPSEIKVTNNEFSFGERRKRTYCPLLHVDGVGIEVSLNHFHDNLSSAIRVEGNDHFIASNLVENVVLEADDEGGLDIYNNSSYFGNRYCWNVWKDIGAPSKFFPRTVAGVRFDGNVCGQQVFANRFIRCGTGAMGSLQSCGGRMHVIDNNLIVDGNRGMSVAKYNLDFWTNDVRRLIKDLCLREVNVTKPPFATHYPGIENLLVTNQVNHFTRNIVVGQAPLLVNAPDETIVWGNRHETEMPDLKKLSRDSYFAPVPEESDVGPRQTTAFRRAKFNDTKED